MKIDQLKTLIAALGNNPSKEDIALAFAQATLIISEALKEMGVEYKKMEQEHKRIVSLIEDDTEFKKLKESIETFFKEWIDKIQSKLDSIKDGEPGKDGKIPTKSELESLIKPLIPPPLKGEPGKDGYTPIKGRDYFDGEKGKDADQKLINDLQNEIYELKEELKKSIENFKTATKTQYVLGSGKRWRIEQVNLSSQLDGVTRTFSIGFGHFGIVSIQSSSAPFGAWIEGTDYNAVGKNLVFTNAVDPAIFLASGQSLIVKVLK